MIVAASLVLGSAGARADTLFDRLGGKPGIDRLVAKTVAIWLTDSRVAPTFEETNMNRFKRLFSDQICMLAGGDCAYSGRSMVEAHKALHLSTLQFNAVAEDMQTAMEQLDIASSTQNRLIALLAPMHRDVVSR